MLTLIAVLASCVLYELFARSALFSVFCAFRKAARARQPARGTFELPQPVLRLLEQQDRETCPRADTLDPAPRRGYLPWEDYFMAIALLSAQRSKDPSKQVGACIVGQNRVILGIGYNGFPRGCTDNALPWCKASKQGYLGTKYPYVVHAEANALLNTNQRDVRGATLYVTMFPCNECAKLLVQAGIACVVYLEEKMKSSRSGQQEAAAHKAPFNKESYAAAQKLFQITGITLRQHVAAMQHRHSSPDACTCGALSQQPA